MNAYDVHFPCSVNDVVYIIDRHGLEPRILQQTVKEVLYTNVDGTDTYTSFYIATSGLPYGFYLHPEDFQEGGIVFSTKEEAEESIRKEAKVK